MITRFAPLVALSAALVLIYGGRFVPLQDYADWVYQADLFARALSGQLPPAFRWTGALAPNSISTLVMGALALVLPVELAGKLFLTATVALSLWAGERFFRARGVTGPLALLSPIFALNYSLLHGNVSYAFGFGLFLASAAYLIRREDSARTPALAAFSLALYLAHGTVLLAWTVLLLCFAGSQNRRARLRSASLALAPVLPLAFWYVAARAPGGSSLVYGDAHGFHFLAFLELKASTFTRMLALFHGFHPLYDAVRGLVVWLVAANFAFLVALVCLLWRAGRTVVRERLWFGFAAFGLLLLCLLAPRESAGLVNPGERLVLPAVFLLALGSEPARHARRLEIAFAVAGAAALAFLLVHAGHARAAQAALQATLEQRACGRRLGAISSSHFDFGATRPPRNLPPGWLLLPRHHPLIHQTQFVELERRAPAPIFGTGFFRYHGAGTTLASRREFARPDLPEVLALIGDAPARALLARELAPRYRELDQGGGFSVIAAHHAAPPHELDHGKFTERACSARHP